MRKLFVVMALVAGTLMASHASQAQQPPYGMAGCGLGSFIFEDNGFVQIFAATTNGTFMSQTFGITSGTSNCVSDGVVTADREQEAFVEANLPNLRRDMASGRGEYLAAFGDLLGCEDSAQPALGRFAQQNYESVFPNETATPQQVLYTFKVQMSRDTTLAVSCNRI